MAKKATQTYMGYLIHQHGTFYTIQAPGAELMGGIPSIKRAKEIIKQKIADSAA